MSEFDPDRYHRELPPGAYYDEEEADRVVNLIESLEHHEGRFAGDKMELMRFQEVGIVRPLFGLKRRDGTRLYREAYIEIPRKNGKSELASAFVVQLLFGDGEPGAEVYGAAYDRDQAKIIYKKTKRKVESHPFLNKYADVREYQNTITFPKVYGEYEALSRKSEKQEGLNVSGAVIDELHTFESREIVDTLKTATGTREQPLVIMITIAGETQDSVAGEQRQYAESIEKGDVEDPEFFYFMSSAQELLDRFDDLTWQDRQVWYWANPALERPETPNLPDHEKGFRSYGELKQQIEKAENVPAMANSVKRRYLNLWIRGAGAWIDRAEWDDCEGAVRPRSLEGSTMYGGLDLAEKIDLASFTGLIPVSKRLENEEGRDTLVTDVHLVNRFYCPWETILERSKEDNVDYVRWAEDGHIIATPGATIDYDYIFDDIDDLATRFDMQTVGYDPWEAVQISKQLRDAGLTMVEMRQRYEVMSPPTKELLRLTRDGRIVHNNPCLSWQIDNLVVRPDTAGNVKPDRRRSGKIDGVVSTIMAIDQWVRSEEHDPGSVYDDREIRETSI